MFFPCAPNFFFRFVSPAARAAARAEKECAECDSAFDAALCQLAHCVHRATHYLYSKYAQPQPAELSFETILHCERFREERGEWAAGRAAEEKRSCC